MSINTSINYSTGPSGTYLTTGNIPKRIQDVINVITELLCDKSKSNDLKSTADMISLVTSRLDIVNPNWKTICNQKGEKKPTGCDENILFSDNQLTKLIDNIKSNSDFMDICKFKKAVVQRVYALPLSSVVYSVNRFPNYSPYVTLGRPSMYQDVLARYSNPRNYPNRGYGYGYGYGGAGPEDEDKQIADSLMVDSIKSFMEEKETTPAVLTNKPISTVTSIAESKDEKQSKESENKLIKYVDFEDFKNQHTDLKEGTIVGKINIKICKVDHEHNYKCKEVNTSINNPKNMDLAYKVMQKLDEHQSLESAFVDIDKLLGMLEYYAVPIDTLDKFKQFKQLEGGNYKRKQR